MSIERKIVCDHCGEYISEEDYSEKGVTFWIGWPNWEMKAAAYILVRHGRNWILDIQDEEERIDFCDIDHLIRFLTKKGETNGS
jgi:hypothetical protein